MNKKVCLISDTHFGIKNGNEVYLKSQMNFFTNQLIPYLKDNGIEHLFILGDLFDNRQSINVRVKNAVFELFNMLKGFTCHVLVGNHDIFFKNTIAVNSLKFLGLYDNVTVYEDIELINVYGKNILMVPWQVNNDDFRQRVANKNVGYDICMGHFEIAGFKMSSEKSDLCVNGLPRGVLFENYELTFSGHFHHRSKKTQGNSVIQYIGNPYHLTRHDIGEDRGFCILDLEDNSYEFISNTESIRYVSVKYPNDFQAKDIVGNIVDIHVTYDKDYDDTAVQAYVNKIENLNPAFAPNLKITNNFQLDAEEVEFKQQSITELFKEYVATLQIDNKDEIYALLVESYKNCKTVN